MLAAEDWFDPGCLTDRELERRRPQTQEESIRDIWSRLETEIITTVDKFREIEQEKNTR